MSNEGYQSRYVADLQALLSAAEASGAAFADYAADATSPELKKLMESGSDEDAKQRDALRELLRSAGAPTDPSANPVIDALVASGKQRVKSSDDPDMKDAAVIDSLRTNLHYYIASYGAAGDIAKRLGRQDDAGKLDDMRAHMVAKESEYGRLASEMTGRDG